MTLKLKEMDFLKHLGLSIFWKGDSITTVCSIWLAFFISFNPIKLPTKINFSSLS